MNINLKVKFTFIFAFYRSKSATRSRDVEPPVQPPDEPVKQKPVKKRTPRSSSSDEEMIRAARMSGERLKIAQKLASNLYESSKSQDDTSNGKCDGRNNNSKNRGVTKSDNKSIKVTLRIPLEQIKFFEVY